MIKEILKKAMLKMKRPEVKSTADVDDKDSDEKIDRISSLDDALLCHILSFLSTKQAIKTSVLSSRWKDVWTKTPVLDFSEYPDTKDKINSKFPSFVSRVLLLNNTSHLKRLRFDHLLEFDVVHVHAWIANLILRDIEEVYLNNWISDQPTDLPLMFFTRMKPVTLKLVGGTISKLPNLVRFSSLKFLHLTDVESPNNNLNRLLAGCPMLEELRIYNCILPCLSIKSTTLKRLTVYYLVDSIGKVLVKARNLEQLSLSCLCISELREMKGLIKGVISHCHIPLPLILHFAEVKSLSLKNTWIEDSVVKALVHSRLVFSNLTNLELQVTRDALLIMPEILRSAPRLVSFVFIKDNIITDSEGKWMTPSFLVECFSSLKNIEIAYFEDSEGFLDMVAYFLKNAKILAQMKLTIVDMSSVNKIKFLRKLLLLPRGSAICQVSLCHPAEN